MSRGSLQCSGMADGAQLFARRATEQHGWLFSEAVVQVVGKDPTMHRREPQCEPPKVPVRRLDQSRCLIFIQGEATSPYS
jgi:hypothetical protein